MKDCLKGGLMLCLFIAVFVSLVQAFYCSVFAVNENQAWLMQSMGISNLAATRLEFAFSFLVLAWLEYDRSRGLGIGRKQALGPAMFAVTVAAMVIMFFPIAESINPFEAWLIAEGAGEVGSILIEFGIVLVLGATALYLTASRD